MLRAKTSNASWRPCRITLCLTEWLEYLCLSWSVCQSWAPLFTSVQHLPKEFSCLGDVIFGNNFYFYIRKESIVQQNVEDFWLMRLKSATTFAKASWKTILNFFYVSSIPIEQPYIFKNISWGLTRKYPKAFKNLLRIDPSPFSSFPSSRDRGGWLRAGR